MATLVTDEGYTLYDDDNKPCATWGKGESLDYIMSQINQAGFKTVTESDKPPRKKRAKNTAPDIDTVQEAPEA